MPAQPYRRARHRETPEGESPGGDVKLRGRNAEVEENPIDPRHLGPYQQLVEITKVAFEKLDARTFLLRERTEALACGRESGVVLIDAYQEAVCAQASSRFARMSCAAERCVHEDVPWFECESFEALGEQDRCVPVFVCHAAHARDL